MRKSQWAVMLLGAVAAAHAMWAFDATSNCVELRKKVDAFTWQYNPFKNPGDVQAMKKVFGQWPMALGEGRLAVLETGCYAEVQITSTGQIASVVYHAGDPLNQGEKADPRPEMRQTLTRLKETLAKMQAEIDWLESQLGEEIPVTRPAPAQSGHGVRITGDAKRSTTGSLLQ